MSRYVIMLLAFSVFFAYLNVTSAQVTFSRDWNPGKRANGDIQCAPSGRSAGTICHMLLAELRQAMACESRSILRNLQADDGELNQPTIFTGRR